MALSKLQVEETLELFVNNFVLETEGIKRKRLVQRFEDTFGRGIVEWIALVSDIMHEKKINEKVVKEFEELAGRNRKIGEEYEYRELCEDDLNMVRELLNYAFDAILTQHNDEHLKKFINGYSFVACHKGDIVGVIMSYPILSLHSDIIFVDSLAVAEYARGRGIARALLDYVHSKAIKNKIYSMKLITDKHLDAYQMYKHLGFKESKYVMMTKW